MARNADQKTTSSETTYAVPCGLSNAPADVFISGRFRAVDVSWTASVIATGCAVVVYTVQAQNIDVSSDVVVANTTGVSTLLEGSIRSRTALT